METRELGAGSYPEAPEEVETNLQIAMTITTTDIFPKKWGEIETTDYIKSNINEFLLNGETEINEIKIWRE